MPFRQLLYRRISALPVTHAAEGLYLLNVLLQHCRLFADMETVELGNIIDFYIVPDSVGNAE